MLIIWLKHGKFPSSITNLKKIATKMLESIKTNLQNLFVENYKKSIVFTKI